MLGEVIWESKIEAWEQGYGIPQWKWSISVKKGWNHSFVSSDHSFWDPF